LHSDGPGMGVLVTSPRLSPGHQEHPQLVPKFPGTWELWGQPTGTQGLGTCPWVNVDVKQLFYILMAESGVVHFFSIWNLYN